MKKKIEKYLAVYEQQLINAGKELDIEKMPVLTEELFSQFENTGNRIGYEKVYFKRRKFLTVYAILAMQYKKSSDISRLEEVILEICDEECWALPAHVNRSETDWKNTIDLFSCETAFSLAEIISILEKNLSEYVCKRAKEEVFRRVLTPFMEGPKPYSWWETTNMNWCAVCCGSIGATAIWLMQNDKQNLDKLINRLSTSIMNYIAGFGEDGACLEGIGYYTYGMSFFLIFADLAYKYTCGKIDLLKSEKMKKIALFQQKCFLSGNISLSFSDSIDEDKYRIGLTTYLSKRYEGIKFPDISLVADLESDNCYRYAVISRDFFWTKSYSNVLRQRRIDGIVYDYRNWHTVLKDAQWSICSSKNNCVMAAKGGNNDEPHNHNDIGSFIYAYEGEVILNDLGSGEYTKDYFGENRYKNLCCRSLGHNVPIIEGKEQLAGANYKASKFEADGEGETIIEFAKAYGLSDEESVTRIIYFDKDKGGCQIKDEFVLDKEKVIIENLISNYTPEPTSEGFLLRTPINKYKIKVVGGSEYIVKEEKYMDHFGVEKKAYLMQWRVVDNECEILIMNGELH